MTTSMVTSFANGVSDVSTIKLTPQLKHLAGQLIYPHTTTGWHKCQVCNELAFARWHGQCADCYSNELHLMQSEDNTTNMLISQENLWPFEMQNPEQATQRLEDMDEISDEFIAFQLSLMLQITSEMGY